MSRTVPLKAQIRQVDPRRVIVNLTSEQQAICERFEAQFLESAADSDVGIALYTLDLLPLNGGDSVDHIYRQAVTAAGSGCEAALDGERWLTHERITERWDLPKGEEERIDS